MIVPLYKFYFENRNEKPFKVKELSYDVDGWKNYGITFGKETGVSNVVKSYTNSWTFVLGDADYLKSIFFKYGSNAKIRLVVKKLSNYLTKKYEIDYAGYFDFSQIVITSTVTIPLSEGGFFKLLENQWSKDHEIKMNNTVLGFNGVKIPETAIMEAYQNQTFIGGDPITIKSFSIGLTPQNKLIDYDFFQTTITKDLAVSGGYTLDDSFLVFKSGFIDAFKISYDLDFSISLKKAYPIGVIFSYSHKIVCDIIEFDYNAIEQGLLTDSDILRTFYLSDPDAEFINAVGNTFNLNYEFKYKKKGTFSIPYNGSNGKVYILRVFLIVSGLNFFSNLETTLTFNSFSLACNLETMLNRDRAFQCVRVNHVFQELINKINQTKYNVDIDFTELNKYVANNEIDRFDVLTNGNGLRSRFIQLTPVQIGVLESVGINVTDSIQYSWAKLTTSLEQFLKFLYSVYGLKIKLDYDNQTDKYKVSLLHEDNSYQNTLINKVYNVKNQKLSVERSFLYTNIKIGYSNKDDSIGGKEEYNSTLEFSTMITEVEENVLDLTSPYSASVFDIETFLYNNYQNFTDSADKDTDIFVLSCKKHKTEGLGYFSLRRGVPVTSGLAFPSSAWNVELTPQRMLYNHSKFLNSCFAFHVNEKLVVSTAKRNRTLNAGGIIESEAYTISKQRLFFPLIFECTAPATNNLFRDIEKCRNGYIEFQINGKPVKGYLHSSSAVTINPMNEKESEFVLLCHGDEFPNI